MCGGVGCHRGNIAGIDCGYCHEEKIINWDWCPPVSLGKSTRSPAEPAALPQTKLLGIFAWRTEGMAGLSAVRTKPCRRFELRLAPLAQRLSSPGRRLLTLRILRLAEFGPQRPATQLLRRTLLLGRVHKGSRRSLSGPAPRGTVLLPPATALPRGRQVKSCFPCSPTGGLTWDATTVSKIAQTKWPSHRISRFAYANRRSPRRARKQRKPLRTKTFAYANGESGTPTLAG